MRKRNYNIKQIIKSLEGSNAPEISGYELSGYEIEQFAALVKKNISPDKAMQMVKANVENPNLREQSNPTVAVSETYDLSGFALIGSAANFTINIKRLTNNIATPLPVPIFGATHYQSAYVQILDMRISPGTTITSFSGGINDTTLPNSNILEIEYTNGADVDKVQISCNTVPYPTFISAMQGNDVFEISKMRISLSSTAVNDLQQFQNTFRNQVATLFGLQKGVDLPVGSAKSPFQMQDGIIDLDGQFYYNKQKMLQVNVINASVNNFTVSISSFVKQFSKDQV